MYVLWKIQCKRELSKTSTLYNVVYIPIKINALIYFHGIYVIYRQTEKYRLHVKHGFPSNQVFFWQLTNMSNTNFAPIRTVHKPNVDCSSTDGQTDIQYGESGLFLTTFLEGGL